MALSSRSLTFSFLFLTIQTLFFRSQAQVPDSETFKFVNQGDFGDYVIEYDGNYRVLQPFAAPFQLCFYNTTPNAYTLALRMALVHSESLFRWVWEANRGNPVGENATLTLGKDGNLVLADADGRVAWQTNTANKGVVGLKLFSNGNMVLRDAKGNFVWQSFDYPTDTLLVGQSLRLGSKLVSRASAENNVNGPYSFVVEPKQLGLCHKSSNSPKPLLYFSSSEWFNITKGTLVNVTFSVSETDEGYSYYFGLDANWANPTGSVGRYLARSKYNGTSTLLRLGIDGNIRFYTYNDKVDVGAWEMTYILFDRDSGDVSECQLPERCGKFGLCEDSQCVACPLPSGLMGWSKTCEPVKVTSCKASDFYYYKLEGVDHFLSRYTKGDGPVKESNCASKCTKDCKCMGYFYHKDTSRCWIAYDLKTLTRVENSGHVGYIKAPKKQ
ncbi:epidermis-specific secreted glycoprotein EP1-like [Diospyros lotus]|uniref:epidermis-specific secreted glycoprotein EP1-like n=1 Tax=Diospyros lotus TaxID=55363 RepID=UPI002259AEBE|nr:epidermis-specific secreted glycoprotein EP1-like [Diospyros lotus]